MEFLKKLEVRGWRLEIGGWKAVSIFRHLNKSNIQLLTSILALLFASCQNDPDKPNPVDVPTPPAKVVPTPDFNQDSAFSFVKKQVDFGPRVPNSAAHAKCADYLTAKLKEYKADVIVQQAEAKAFDGKVLKMKNIIAQWQPEKQNRIMLCAHLGYPPLCRSGQNRYQQTH
jgi:hypothetical protein